MATVQFCKALKTKENLEEAKCRGFKQCDDIYIHEDGRILFLYSAEEPASSSPLVYDLMGRIREINESK